MVSDQRKTANAIGGKTARACDGCMSKRARWFCVADDAFLCQSCDVSVHSANLLASRHQRVRLGTSSHSFSPRRDEVPCDDFFVVPKKPRTKRGRTRQTVAKSVAKSVATDNDVSPFPPLVPEIGGSDNDDDNDPEQLFCQVPVLLENDLNALLDEGSLDIPPFLSSDVELAEFVADVESLFAGEEEEANNNSNNNDNKSTVKIEIGDDRTEAVNWEFEEEVEQKVTILSGLLEESSSVDRESGSSSNNNGEVKMMKKKEMLLTLNYEQVISDWSSHGGCPWTDGTRPVLDPYHCWPDFMGVWYGGDHHEEQAMNPYVRRSNEGREARVTRYREKRRTRLFSKKIRYEVRKLNAEKRPRVKGRFVKRTSLFQPPQQHPRPPSHSTSSFANYLVSNRHL